MKLDDPSRSTPHLAPAILNSKLQDALILLLGFALWTLAATAWLRGAREPNVVKPRISGKPAYLIDLNLATEPELDLLPRVGPLSARRIIQDRIANGPFLSIDDLNRVPGIGPKTVDGVKPFCMPVDRAEASKPLP